MKKLLIGVAASAVMFGAMTATAFAAGAIGEWFSSAEPGIVGPRTSGEFYGNTSNPSGNGNGVLPSLAPGPWACASPPDYCAFPTNPGGSMGALLAPLASGGVATPDFANGNDPDIDFSLH